MRRMAEILAFLGLSAAVHAGVMAGFGDTTGGPQAQGQAGADRITLAAAPESMATLANRWAEPPQPMISPAALPAPQMVAQPLMPSLEDAAPALSMPQAPALARTDAPPLAPNMTESAPPPSPNALAQSPRPMLRPDVASAPAATPQAAYVSRNDCRFHDAVARNRLTMATGRKSANPRKRTASVAARVASRQDVPTRQFTVLAQDPAVRGPGGKALTTRVTSASP